MRKIEARIIAALREQSEFKAGNTEVRDFIDAEQAPRIDGKRDMQSKVELHGNLIAQYNRSLNQLDIRDSGYSTVTTKSRLNALLSEFAPAYRIVQRDWEWFIDDLSQDTDSLIPWTGAATFRAGTLIDRW